MRHCPSPRRWVQEEPPSRSIHPDHHPHQNCASIVTFHRRIAAVAFVVHVASLFACAAASATLSSSSASSATVSPSPTATSTSFTPCSALFPPASQQAVANETEKCFVWNERETPRAICSTDTTTRVFRLRSTFLFPQQQPLSLYEVFAAGSGDRDIPSRLRAGVAGADCMRSSPKRCEACFNRLAHALRDLDDAYRSFDEALQRFDCLPALDTASATRPFSPNGSCTTCRSWYRRWLLVQMAPVWKAPPCINWCYYAQLACPHLATSKVVDYAGHPSFQCRDLAIASRGSEHLCNCVHPCDLRGIVGHRRSRSADDASGEHFDFYAADSHCATRARQCAARSTAHDRTSSTISVSSSLTALISLTIIFIVAR